MTNCYPPVAQHVEQLRDTGLSQRARSLRSLLNQSEGDLLPARVVVIERALAVAHWKFPARAPALPGGQLFHTILGTDGLEVGSAAAGAATAAASNSAAPVTALNRQAL
jgi:hypothetical protein